VQPVTVRVEGSSAEAVTAGFDRGTIEMQMHPVLEPMKLKLHDRRTHILAIGAAAPVPVRCASTHASLSVHGWRVQAWARVSW
jgi:hypothetical protein